MNNNTIACVGDKCTGCGVCQTICPRKAISFVENAEGFLYPVIDKDICSKCSLCMQKCHALNTSVGQYRGAIVHAALHHSDVIRNESSSGGVFSALATQMIAIGGLVVGARYEEDGTVFHDIAEVEREVCAFMRSKYVQSHIGEEVWNEIKAALENERHVLFSGTPCQIAALKRYLGKEYETLLCVEVICHGVPSPGVWRKYIQEQEEVHQSKIKNISCRDQELEGWSNFGMYLSFENGSVYRATQKEDLYLRGFLSNCYLRKSCFECGYKNLNSQADLTIGDFWGIQKFRLDLFDNKGASVILAQTQKGEDYIQQIENISLFEGVSFNEIVEENSDIINCAPYSKNRFLFYRYFKKSGKQMESVSNTLSRVESPMINLIFNKISGLHNYKHKERIKKIRHFLEQGGE